MGYTGSQINVDVIVDGDITTTLSSEPRQIRR
jgi:hypothetical protein